MSENAMPMADPRLSEIRKVELSFRDSSPSSYLIHVSEVATFVEATKRLHFNPGKNPHNGNETSKVYKITVGKLNFEGPYWWCGPDLGTKPGATGARIIDNYAGEIVFIDEKYVSTWEDEDD